jgi:hypothetical protein
MSSASATIAHSSDDDGHWDVHRSTQRGAENRQIIAIASATLKRVRWTAPLIAIGWIRNVSEFSDPELVLEPIG